MGTIVGATIACVESVNISTLEPPTPTIYATEEPIDEIYLNDTIKLATFNIQVFGNSKSNKPEILDYLSQIACEFDLMAIQEIRSVDNHDEIINNYVSLINQACDEQRSYIINKEPLGRSSSKENYAFIFNTATIDFIEGTDISILIQMIFLKENLILLNSELKILILS